jgi:hypothetical protein
MKVFSFLNITNNEEVASLARRLISNSPSLRVLTGGNYSWDWEIFDKWH